MKNLLINYRHVFNGLEDVMIYIPESLSAVSIGVTNVRNSGGNIVKILSGLDTSITNAIQVLEFANSDFEFKNYEPETDVYLFISCTGYVSPFMVNIIGDV